MVKRSNKNKKQIDALEEEEEEVVFTRYPSEYDKNKNRI